MVTFRSLRMTRTAGARVTRVNQGTNHSDTPRITPTPLPPWNFKKTGQLCPAKAMVLVMNMVQWGASANMGASTANTPFPVSASNTRNPGRAPAC